MRSNALAIRCSPATQANDGPGLKADRSADTACSGGSGDSDRAEPGRMARGPGRPRPQALAASDEQRRLVGRPAEVEMRDIRGFRGEGGPGEDSLGHLLTVAELAHYLQLNPKTVYAWSSRGRIPCVRAGRSLRFRLSDVLQRLGQ